MSIIDRELVLKKYLPKWESYNHQSNYASSAGHPCDRYLTLCRTSGEHKAEPDEIRRGHMARGLLIEDIALGQLKAAGYEVYQQQRKLEIVENDQLLWRGKIEGVIRDPRKGPSAPVHALEVKSPDERAWEKLTSIEDFSRAAWYHRSYLDQLMLYIYAKGESEDGILCLMHPRTLLPKYIEVPMDYGRVQDLLTRARRVNAHLQAKTLPDPIEWGTTCERCDLLSTCLPDQLAKAQGLQVWDMPGFEAQLLRWERLKFQFAPAKAEFEKLDKEIKDAVRGRGEIVVGDFWLNTAVRKVKGFSVAEREDQIVTVKRFQGAIGAAIAEEVA